MLCCLDADWKVVTWLRYTMWIPLYPLGCLAEGTGRGGGEAASGPSVLGGELWLLEIILVVRESGREGRETE